MQNKWCMRLNLSSIREVSIKGNSTAIVLKYSTIPFFADTALLKLKVR